MSQTSSYLCLLFCAACAQLDNEPSSAVDPYSAAAKSWIGADVQEMLAAWPSPTRHCGSNTIGEAGCVWWRHFSTGGGRISSAQQDYQCEVIARYNEAGIISKIDVRQSHYCYRLFGDYFERMTRQMPPSKGLEIEEVGQ